MKHKPKPSKQVLFGAAIVGATIGAGQASAETLTPSPSNGSVFNEGDTVNISVEFSNFNLAYFGSGSFEVSGGSPSGASFPFAFSASGDAPFSRSASVTFADEGTVIWTAQGNRSQEGSSTPFGTGGNFIIQNVDPTIDTPQADAPVDFAVSSILNFGAAASDLGVLDVLTYDWDLDGDGSYDDFTGPSGAFDYQTLPGVTNGVIHAALRVNDGDGGVAINTFDVTLTNVPEAASATVLSLACVALQRRRGRRGN